MTDLMEQWIVRTDTRAYKFIYPQAKDEPGFFNHVQISSMFEHNQPAKAAREF